VTDSNGCVDMATDSVTGTDPVTLTTGSTSPTACGLSDGTITVTVVTGTAPYAYTWSPAGGSTSVAVGLSAGIYTVSVIDIIGCTSTDTVTLTDVGAPTLTIVVDSMVICYGGSDGVATVNVFSAASPFTYSWSTSPAQTNAQATGLMAGLYSVTVTDSASCSNFISTTITGPTSGVTVDSTGYTDISCFGLTDGTGTVAASGGTSPLTYSWNTTPVQTNAMATGLGMGGYTVTVMDANGCSVMDSSVTITEPTAITANAVGTNIKCFGDGDGAVDLTATGGTPTLSFLWSNAATTEDLTGLSAGNYTVTVTDGNGCFENTGIQISEPTALTVVTTLIIDESALGAMDGQIDMTVTGGTEPWTYFWTPGNETTVDLSGLGGGTYTILVTDANSCTATQTVSVQPGPSAIGAVKFDVVFNVYPNPNDGSFVVKIQNLKGDDYNLEIRNIIGQLVYTEVISDVTGKLRKEVNMKEQERGVYFLSVTNEEGNRTEKLIIF
ncbi:MAG TPA: T9SS type A sorting domain-containing protein, partial [Flavobacteriales bacterium]|nr:T9SS type A sorting domain-containing protein [Flavobacteriales bacterium]